MVDDGKMPIGLTAAIPSTWINRIAGLSQMLSVSDADSREVYEFHMKLHIEHCLNHQCDLVMFMYFV